MSSVAVSASSNLTDRERSLLASLAGECISFDEPLSRRTTLGIGGLADAWYSPTNIDDLQRVIKACAEREISMLPVGGGSNLLVRDRGVRGVCISTRQLRALQRVETSTVVAQSGVSTGKLLSSAINWELSGLEFLAGVPGSVGGGLIMNAGTRLGEFKDVTTRVTSISLASGEIVKRDGAQCGFAYRSSDLPSGEIVASGEFSLVSKPKAEISAVVRAFREQRRKAEPKGHSSAGSVFRNPPGDFAGRLIEETGLKGTQIGGALCSPVHANWFVNTGGASAADMLELIELAREKVREMHGIQLELEWKVIGEEG